MSMPRKNSNISTGAAILILIFALLFFVLAARFFYIQASGKAEGQALAEIAQRKYTRETTIEGQRGTIYDRNSEAVAHDTGAYTVVAILDPTQTKNKKNPQHVVDPEKTAEKLAPLLDMKKTKLEELLTKNSFQVELGPGGRDINNALKQKIEKLKLPGITFLRDSKRFYPNGVFASHILGYAQKNDEGKIIGKMGIEQVYNKQMSEEDGKVYYQAGQNGIKLPDPKESIDPPKNGDNIYLTIDEKIQTFVEDAMTNAQKEYNPDKMMAVVVNPKTGEILGMSSRPTFNPNVRKITDFQNPIVENSFELGSTMKIFTLAAAIEEGVYNGNDMYQSGSYKVSDKDVPIRDHNSGNGWGPITFDEGIRRSSNVAIAILANEKLGTDKLFKYLDKFGFMEKTGIDLPGEVSSKLISKYPRDRVTTAFGQGSAFTPIQQIQAATAIANDGKMMKPYVIQKIVDGTTNKVKKETKPKVVRKPISKETSQQVLKILETVVSEDDGTGKTYAIDGYDVAGKTGTAQIPNPNGGYLHGHGKNLFSFMGFAPANNPSLIVYVAVQNPKLTAQETGSAPLSMIFNSVMKNSLQSLGIEPTQKTSDKQGAKKTKSEVKLDNYRNEKVNDVVTELKEKGLTPVVIGEGNKIDSQSPKADETVISGEKVLLKTTGKATMPDVTGWSHRDIIRFTEFTKLRPSALEKGFVVKQSIKPGTELKENGYLVVELEVPKSLDETIEKVKGEEKEKEKLAKEGQEKKPIE
ncbi:PASTA domain-containing protein [Priestia megaterium]|nr:PASTA domain-containing protein [Priestia megaterium]